MKLYNEIYHETENIVRTLGIASGTAGRTYIIAAAMLVIQQPWRTQAVTKYLYPRLAEQYGVTWFRIERNIRYGINTAWNRENSGMHRLMGHRPTSRELISYIADSTLLNFPDYMQNFSQMIKPSDSHNTDISE